jgi:GPH family glycoside/pentoside/hexuronide:cation symporter
VKDLLRNAPWFILLGAGISTIFFNTIRDAAAIYYFKYYVQSDSAISFNALNVTIALSTLYLLLGQAANIIGVVLAKPVSDKIGKKNTFLYAMLMASILSLVFYGLKGNHVIYIFVLQFFISISAGIIFPLVWSMYADTAIFRSGKTNECYGLVFSAASMSQKFGASLVLPWLAGC